MSRPGVNIVLLEEPPARTPPTDTGVFFAIGPATKGSDVAAKLVRSFSEFQTLYGARTTTSYLWDAMDCYFKEGGSRAYIARVVGPAPVNSSVVLKDGSNVDTLTVEANSPGEWGDSLTVEVIAGSVQDTFVLQIADATDPEEPEILEVSRDLEDKADALLWAESSDYIILTDMASTD